MTLAEFYGLQSVMDLDASMAAAIGRIVALVPATAGRLGVSTDQVWQMPAEDAVRALAATVPALLTDANMSAMQSVADALKSAFSVAALVGDKAE